MITPIEDDPLWQRIQKAGRDLNELAAQQELKRKVHIATMNSLALIHYYTEVFPDDNSSR